MANPPEDRGGVSQPYVNPDYPPPGAPVDYQPLAPQRSPQLLIGSPQPGPFAPIAPVQTARSKPHSTTGPGAFEEIVPGQASRPGLVQQAGRGAPYLSEHDERMGRVGPHDSGWDEEIPGGPTLARRQAQWFAGDPIGAPLHLTITTTASGITVPDFAMAAYVSVVQGDVRMRFDGGIAAAALGLYVANGSVLKLTGRPTLHQLSVILATGAPVLDVVFFQ